MTAQYRITRMPMAKQAPTATNVEVHALYGHCFTQMMSPEFSVS